MIGMALKGAERKVESESIGSEGTFRYCELRNTSEKEEDTFQMHQCRQNIAVNKWFAKEKEKLLNLMKI